ncbi:aminoglycoside phosphotransferase family protein [Nocardia sp. NPDC019395]|uniref:phosphotransferase family protein n=1 Tax=Nocardia sp. NPDC019395 TaxID=3154686 RepID=UPI0033DF8DB9
MASSNQFHPAVPRTMTDLLSPEWLTRALSARYPGVRITRVTPGPVVSRVSTNARFHIESDDGLPPGLSPDLCGKGYFSDAGWSARQAGVFEVFFYRHLAAATGIRTLHTVYADVDENDQHGVVITEDVVAQGARFLDATSDYTPDQVADSLAELAILHAATWADPGLGAADWLTSRLESYSSSRGVKEIRGNFESEIGRGVPEEVRDADRLVAAHRALAAQARTAQPWSVIHGDTHVGNLYLDGAGRPAFLDWQLVQRGPWYIDVGYHIASTLTVEDRRSAEKDLLRHYLERLRAGGVDAPTWDEAWLGLRRGIVHGFFLWSITLKVDPAITTMLQHRLGTAAADHDSFATVGV